MISIELQGRLGNHLYQYAVARVMAEKIGCEYTIPNGKLTGGSSVTGGWLGNKIFNCDMGVQPFKKQPNIFTENNDAYTPEINDIKDNTHLNGWWQSEQYFEGYENKIREWYNIEKPDSPYIGGDYCIIHFRAQDAYLHHNLLPKSYFVNAKNYVIEKTNNNINFVIVTDNPTKAKEYFTEDIIIHNDMKTDFQLIMYSKYKIISHSTFSWWASWLGEPDSEIIIAPNRWLNNNYRFSKDESFYPKSIKTKNFIYL